MSTTLLGIIAALGAFTVTTVLGFFMIPWLRKLKFGQTILDIGPKWHKKKQGIPTMGGIMFIIGVTVSFVAVYVTDYLTGKKIFPDGMATADYDKMRLWGGIAMALLFAFIGFMDDYIKVVKKRNLGLTIKQKTFMQLLVAVAYTTVLYYSGSAVTYIPFIGKVDMGWFFWIFAICVLYGAINAINFTDGLDGLCSSVTLTVAVSFIVMAAILKFTGISILAAALAGGCAGFLVWNHYPAKVFMGDTGSLFLGGLVVALAFGINCPVILIPVGIIYIIEALSDVIQITYFKATHGKRIFKMAPIHHHFEMSGWSEVKIVSVFTTINLIGAVIGILCVWFG